MSRYDGAPDLIGADGKPVEHGDTVYELGKVKPIIVGFVDYVDRRVSGFYANTGVRVYNLRPEQLTHEAQPDSWERIGADLARIEEAQGACFPMYGPLKSLICRAQALMDRDGGRL